MLERTNALTALRVGDETIVFFDQYRLDKCGAVATRDFEHWYDATNRISIPKGANHGSIITIESATYLRLERALAAERDRLRAQIGQ